MTNQPPSNKPDNLHSQLIELEQKLMFQQRSYDELNGVVLEQQAELEQLRREVRSLQQTLQGLIERGVGEDLPHEKPPHY